MEDMFYFAAGMMFSEALRDANDENNNMFLPTVYYLKVGDYSKYINPDNINSSSEKNIEGVIFMSLGSSITVSVDPLPSSVSVSFYDNSKFVWNAETHTIKAINSGYGTIYVTIAFQSGIITNPPLKIGVIIC